MASWEEFSRIVAEAKAAKKLDPVGKEDDDINNDNKVDSTDDYLKNKRSAVGAAIAADKKKKSGKDSDEMCEAKVDEKLPEHERATARDKRSGHNLPGSGTRRVRRAEHEDRRGKPKRWWDDDGDGIGWEKGEVKKESVEQIDEFSLPGTGTVLAPRTDPKTGTTRMDTKQKFLGMNVPLSQKFKSLTPSKSDTARYNAQPNRPTTINRQDDFIATSTPNKPKPTSAPKTAPQPSASDKAVQGLRSAASSGRMGGTFQALSNRRAAIDAAVQNNSYQPEGEMVEEDKEYRREMRKAAARERAEEKSGRKEEGKRAAKAPGRLGPSAGKSYADKEELSIKGHDEVTKKSKHTHGNPFPEHVEYVIEKGMSKDEMSSVLKGHRYSKQELLNMSKKSTKEGRHGEAAAFYHEFQKEETAIDEGMTMKDFKANRKKLQRKEASVDAEKRGHEGKEWYNSGRKYGTDEAKSRRSKMSDDDRAARHRASVDPDDDRDENTYSADKTKNPKKLRKQKAMGELGEGYIEEKSLSRAQQRFMGMVYAAKKGETPASPEVAKAASGMSKKAARDFAKTKHEGLPEKKEDAKEELSLVDQIILEAISGTITGGKSRAKKYKIQAKDVRIKQIGSAALSGDKKLVKKLKKANEKPTLKITEKGSIPKKSEEERKEAAKKEVKRGKSDPSANVRSGIVRGVIELKKEKEKTKRQRERQQYDKERRAEKKAEKQKEFESSYKEKRIKAAQQQSDKEEARKAKTKDDMKKAVKKGLGSIKIGYISDKENAAKAADQTLSNVGSIAGGILKAGKGVIGAKMKERDERKQEQKRSERHEKIRKEMSKEEYSNWREEFILEVDDQSVQNEKQKVIDVSKKKNKIEINPNMSEGCGCDEKEKTEKPQKDMRDLPTKVNLAKTKARSAGVRNPIVMVATEGAAWTKKEGKSEAGGLNEKGRKSYERENPGSDLKAPSKKVGNPRRASFCARMSGMKAKLTSKKTANDPDSRINKSLRAWNC